MARRKRATKAPKGKSKQKTGSVSQTVNVYVSKRASGSGRARRQEPAPQIQTRIVEVPSSQPVPPPWWTVGPPPPLEAGVMRVSAGRVIGADGFEIPASTYLKRPDTYVPEVDRPRYRLGSIIPYPPSGPALPEPVPNPNIAPAKTYRPLVPPSMAITKPLPKQPMMPESVRPIIVPESVRPTIVPESVRPTIVPEPAPSQSVLAGQRISQFMDESLMASVRPSLKKRTVESMSTMFRLVPSSQPAPPKQIQEEEEQMARPSIPRIVPQESQMYPSVEIGGEKPQTVYAQRIPTSEKRGVQPMGPSIDIGGGKRMTGSVVYTTKSYDGPQMIRTPPKQIQEEEEQIVGPSIPGYVLQESPMSAVLPPKEIVVGPRRSIMPSVYMEDFQSENLPARASMIDVPIQPVRISTMAEEIDPRTTTVMRETSMEAVVQPIMKQEEVPFGVSILEVEPEVTPLGSMVPPSKQDLAEARGEVISMSKAENQRIALEKGYGPEGLTAQEFQLYQEYTGKSEKDARALLRKNLVGRLGIKKGKSEKFESLGLDYTQTRESAIDILNRSENAYLKKENVISGAELKQRIKRAIQKFPAGGSAGPTPGSSLEAEQEAMAEAGAVSPPEASSPSILKSVASGLSTVYQGVKSGAEGAGHLATELITGEDIPAGEPVLPVIKRTGKKITRKVLMKGGAFAVERAVGLPPGVLGSLI